MQNLTPLPEPTMTTMTFPDAIKKIIDGKRVTRMEWKNKDYCLLLNEWLSIYTKDDFHVWKVNDGDLNATDWIEVLELN